MAKVVTPNVATPGADIGHGLSALSDLLLANGWTVQATGTGTGGTRSATNQLTTPGLWIAATSTWMILYRGGSYVTLLRNAATSLTVRFAVAAPSVTGSTTVPDSQAVAANEIAFTSISVTGANRAHAVSFDSDSNAAGIRSFYLIFTDGSALIRGSIVLEAMADGSYATANPAPYVVSAATQGTPFVNTGSLWAWWYSPTSIWVSANAYNNYLAGSTIVAGVDPWSGEDQMIAPCWGRATNVASPGLLGQAAFMRSACVFRSYPSTVNLATDAYLYVGSASGSSLIPWANGVTPL